MEPERKPPKKDPFGGEDLEIHELRTWLVSEQEKFKALNPDFIQQNPKADLRQPDNLTQQLVQLMEKAQDKIDNHSRRMLNDGYVSRAKESMTWSFYGYHRLSKLLKAIGYTNSKLQAIAAPQERHIEYRRAREANSEDARAGPQDMPSKMEQIRAYTNEMERNHTELKSEKIGLLESSAEQEYLMDGVAQQDINSEKPDTIADLHSTSCATLSFLSSLGDGTPYKGEASCESAAMNLKRWAVGFTKGELALDRVLEDGDEGKQFLKACIVGALVDIIGMEGNLLESINKSGFKRDPRAQSGKIKAMIYETKAILERADVIIAAEDQSAPGLEVEDGMDIFVAALGFIEQTTASLFDLVPAIRTLRQEKLLSVQKLDGRDCAEEKPPTERKERADTIHEK